MKINSLELVSRYNRPSHTDDVGLELYYLKNGALDNPYQIDSVLIFPDTVVSSDRFPYITNGDGSALIYTSDTDSDCYGKVHSGIVSSCVARFQPSGGTVVEGTGNFDASANYDSSGFTSGISRLGTGHFAVGLSAGGQYVSGAASSCDLTLSAASEGLAVEGVSAAGVYFEVWQIQHANGGGWQSYVQKFEVIEDSVITFPEQPVFSVSNSLKQTYVNHGEVINLAIRTNISSDEANLGQEILDLFRQSIIENAEIKISYINNSNVRIQSGAGGSTNGWVAVSKILSNDTMLYKWDTSSAVLHTVYEVQVKYTLMDETHMSEVFKVLVRI